LKDKAKLCRSEYKKLKSQLPKARFSERERKRQDFSF